VRPRTADFRGRGEATTNSGLCRCGVVRRLERPAFRCLRDILFSVEVPEVKTRNITLSLPAEILGAIDIQRQSGVSFWDATVIRSAARLGCFVLWSGDLDPGQV